jgi:non-specific protein-tyrosine kinase
MDLLQYVHIIRKRIGLIVLLVVVGIAGAGYYVLNQKPEYRTSTTLAISPAILDSTVTYQVTDDMLPLANTYSEFMKTRSFAQAVLQQLQTQALPLLPTENEILSAIIARYLSGTQLFRITATYHDPAVAKALADTTAQMLIRANEERVNAQQEALVKAQAGTRRVQEIDRLAEMISVLGEELNYHEDRILALERQIAVLRSGPQSVETDTQILNARNELLASRTARVELLGSLANAQRALLAETEKANDNVDVVVLVEESWFPTEPLPYNMLQPFLAALAAALALGVALAIGIEYMDASVKSPEELDTIYGMPTLGAIGLVDPVDPALGRAGNLVMLNSPRSPFAETIRVLRTALRMTSIGKPLGSLLITSSRVGEGKTFITANLAVSIAQAGKQVILVDADLRRPAIHNVFGLHNEPGFTNLIVEELRVDEVLQPTRVPGLRILTSGTLPPNPAELLSSEQARALMRVLEEKADLVIYDSSPATTVTDAVILAPAVDGVLQVVGARGTRVDMVQRCKELLERSGAHVIGAVLNRVAAPDLGYYGNYYSDNGYFANDAEQEEKKSGWRWPWQSAGKQRLTGPSKPAERADAFRTIEPPNGNGYHNLNKPVSRAPGRSLNRKPSRWPADREPGA